MDRFIVCKVIVFYTLCITTVMPVSISVKDLNSRASRDVIQIEELTDSQHPGFSPDDEPAQTPPPPPPPPPPTDESSEGAVITPTMSPNGTEPISGKVNPLESAELFEGDIAGVNDATLRNAIRNPRQKWLRKTVPYVISNSFSSRDRTLINGAFSAYHRKTCIRFTPRTNQRDYIRIRRLRGCSSTVGRAGGAQDVSLGYGCMHHGVIVHELMHALGFWHEQSRADRDSYVIVNWQNIQRGLEYNFQKYTLRDIQHLGEPYDYNSLMHYGPYDFSANRRQTITPRQSGATIGQRRGLSKIDIRKLNKLYTCGTVEPTPPKPKPKPKPGSCRNQNKHCASWARTNECSKNPAYMLVYCKQACNACNEAQCVDKNMLCSAWSVIGECSRNPRYMLVSCKKSCGKC